MLCCGAATLLNPFGVRLYGIIWEYATQTTPLGAVQVPGHHLGGGALERQSSAAELAVADSE